MHNDLCRLEIGMPSLNALVKNRQRKFMSDIRARNDYEQTPILQGFEHSTWLRQPYGTVFVINFRTESITCHICKNTLFFLKYIKFIMSKPVVQLSYMNHTDFCSRNVVSSHTNFELRCANGPVPREKAYSVNVDKDCRIRFTSCVNAH